MHQNLVLLFVFSVILIILMVTCFICFIRSRKKEELEFLQQVQYTSRQNQQQQHQQPSPKLNQQTPSNNLMINESSNRQLAYQGEQTPQSQQQQQQQQAQLMADYAAGMSGRNQNPYGPTDASPYHKQQTQVSPRATETRSDITQQINSAIIGSSEAEFQNDFIQVSVAAGRFSVFD